MDELLFTTAHTIDSLKNLGSSSKILLGELFYTDFLVKL